MNAPVWLDYLNWAEFFVCLAALVLITRRLQLATFRFLSGFLAVRVFTFAIATVILYYVSHSTNKYIAYNIYFNVYWIAALLECLLLLGIAHDLFKVVLPLGSDLSRIGLAIVKVLIGVSTAHAVWVCHLVKGPRYGLLMTAFVSTLHMDQSFLTLAIALVSLVLIRTVRVAARPLVVSISLGLILLAVGNLSSLLPKNNISVYQRWTVVNLVLSLAACTIWAIYFALAKPEPAYVDSRQIE